MARIQICLAAGVALAVVLAGCAGEQGAPEVGPPAGASSAAAVEATGKAIGAETATTGTPENDGTAQDATGDQRQGTSPPIAPGPDAPAENTPTVSLPSLPIGGNASEPNAAGTQCADVNWRGDPDTPADLVPGVRVAVTGVVFVPEVFTLVEDTCPSGLPPCTGFVYQAAARQCAVAAAPVREPGDQGGQYYFQLTGRLECPGLSKEKCAAFAEAAANVADQSIELNPPPDTSATGAADGDTGGTSGGGAGGISGTDQPSSGGSGDTGTGTGGGDTIGGSSQTTQTSSSDASPPAD